LSYGNHADLGCSAASGDYENGDIFGPRLMAAAKAQPFVLERVIIQTGYLMPASLERGAAADEWIGSDRRLRLIAVTDFGRSRVPFGDR